MTDRSVVVTAAVVTTDEHHIARAIEAFARAAAGLALEGIAICIEAETVTEDETEDEEITRVSSDDWAWLLAITSLAFNVPIFIGNVRWAINRRRSRRRVSEER